MSTDLSVGNKSRQNGAESAAPRGNTADRLLTVAAQLFRENGYAATTTREIAQRLDLQKGSLYHHIQGKEDLLYRIVTDGALRLQKDVSEALTTAPPDGRVQALMHAHLTAALRDRDMHAVTLIELRALSDERRAEVVGRRDDYFKMLVDLIEDEQKSGRIRTDVASKILALALLDMLNWVIFWYQPEGELTADELGNQLAEIYLHGAAAGAKPNPGRGARSSRAAAPTRGRRKAAGDR